MRLMLCYLKFDWFCPSKIDLKVSPPFCFDWFYSWFYNIHPIQPPSLACLCVLQIRRLRSNILFDCTSLRSSSVEGSKSNPSFFDVWFKILLKGGESSAWTQLSNRSCGPYFHEWFSMITTDGLFSLFRFRISDNVLALANPKGLSGAQRNGS